MNYGIDRALLLAEQLRQLATRQAYQLAGHHANLSFWLAEVEQAIATIDGYQDRFRRLRDAQVEWVRQHGIRVDVFCEHCGGACEFGPQPPPLPIRTASEDLEVARAGVRDAFARLLLRFHRLRLLDDAEVRALALRVKAPFDERDLRPAR